MHACGRAAAGAITRFDHGQPPGRAAHRLLRAGLNPVLVVIEPHGQFGVIRERARQLGVAAHLVANEADLKRWAAGRSLPLAA